MATRAALAAYRLVRRSGLLELEPVDAAFCAAYFLYKRHLEDPFAELAAAHPELFAGGSVLDVGANIGYTATVFARAVQDGEKVFAFEPDSDNFQRLRRTTARLSAVEPRQLAVGRAPGQVELWRNLDHHADHRVTTTYFDERASDEDRSAVAMTSIDVFVEERGWPSIAFIKIDVQGYEIEVCRGMVATLERNPNAVVAVEYSPDSSEELGFGRDEVLEHFENLGYEALLVSRSERLVPVTAQEIQRLGENGGYADVLYRRRGRQ
jgi:FkbM family methyltransferase